VYSISVFIIATLITELDFLEKLAALSWGRKEYWEYRIALTKATRGEREAKVANEAMASQEFWVNVPRSEVVKNLLARESRILVLVTRFFSINLPDARFESNVALRSSSGETAVIDALVRTPNEDFILEIKTVQPRASLQKAIDQLRRYLALYTAVAGPARRVRGILVVPENTRAETIVDDDIAILRYDDSLTKFINEEEFQEWISAI
jgi:hypothetical protein